MKSFLVKDFLFKKREAALKKNLLKRKKKRALTKKKRKKCRYFQINGLKKPFRKKE